MPLLLAAFFLEIGFVLLVVPWSSYWDRNFFSQSWPALHALLTSNYMRGAVSGLGIVNVLAAVCELLEVFAGRSRQGMSGVSMPLREPPPEHRP